MPYYNVNKSAKNIRAMKARKALRKKSRGQNADGMSKPYSDMSGGMTNVRKRKSGRARIRYDKM